MMMTVMRTNATADLIANQIAAQGSRAPPTRRAPDPDTQATAEHGCPRGFPGDSVNVSTARSATAVWQLLSACSNLSVERTRAIARWHSTWTPEDGVSSLQMAAVRSSGRRSARRPAASSQVVESDYHEQYSEDQARHLTGNICPGPVDGIPTAESPHQNQRAPDDSDGAEDPVTQCSPRRFRRAASQSRPDAAHPKIASRSSKTQVCGPELAAPWSGRASRCLLLACGRAWGRYSGLTPTSISHRMTNSMNTAAMTATTGTAVITTEHTAIKSCRRTRGMART